MTWPILIGASSSGEALIGAAAVRKAEALDRLHDSARVFPSQLPHRVIGFYPDRGTATGYRGTDPRLHSGDPIDRLRPGRWRIVTPSQWERDRAEKITIHLPRRFEADARLSVRRGTP